MNVDARARQLPQSFPHRVGRRAIARHINLAGRPQSGYPLGRIRRRVGQRQVTGGTIDEPRAVQCLVGQQLAGQWAPVQARCLQSAGEQQHQRTLVNRKIVLLARGQRLIYETLDP